MSKGLEEVTVKTLKTRCLPTGLQAETQALDFASLPIGRQTSIFAVI